MTSFREEPKKLWGRISHRSISYIVGVRPLKKKMQRAIIIALASSS
jgi:hypothetical protein